ncbi:hypothetical protein GCM10007242_11520 [Pigmentiphaga litoralis]|nr:hypothetical protein GCM10007242_11520 [Pigmentiphaga litoralis]
MALPIAEAPIARLNVEALTAAVPSVDPGPDGADVDNGLRDESVRLAIHGTGGVLLANSLGQPKL